MDADSIATLLAPYLPAEELSPLLLSQVQTHLDLLLRWNQRINLTSIRSPEEIVRRHFGESLFAAFKLLSRDSRCEVIDIGSGAGFPGIPLKYWAPQLQLTLIESHGKKATFLREVGRANSLDGFSVLNQRAEAVESHAALVTLRAVEHFEQALPAAVRLVAPGGRLAALIGRSQLDGAVSLLPPGSVSTSPIPNSDSRVLLTWNSAS